MAAYLIAFVIGILQFILLRQILSFVFKNDTGRMILFILIKLVLYGVPLFILIRWYRTLVIGTAIGFGAGFGLCLIIFIISSFRKMHSRR